MNVPLRVMLTAEHAHLVAEAAALEGEEKSAWARAVLLRAAKDRIAKTSARKAGRE
jgi:hypothetical protein